MTTDDDPVLAVKKWSTNADMIADVARLGYLDGNVLDLSYGRGKFWTKHRPTFLTTNDLDPGKGDHHEDVTGPLRFDWYGRFDSVVWDGPYRLSGTRDDAKLDGGGADFDERYGIDGDYQPVSEVMGLLEAGVKTASRCVCKGGFVLVKCQNQVAGQKHFQAYRLAAVGAEHGLVLVDEFIRMTTKARPQPKGRAQLRARSNYSTLLIMRRPHR